jgi:hypothetical protein
MTLLSYLLATRTLRIKSDPYLKAPIVSTFRLRGLRSALKELQKSCPAESSEHMEPLEFDSSFEDE